MDDERQIVKLFEDGDRALIAANVHQLQRIYADDYLQCTETGEIVDKQQLIQKLTSGAVRFINMTSTGRRVRLFGDFAVVHGSEEDVIEQDGLRFSVRYLYMDVVMKREGRWQIVASQLLKI